MAKDKRSPRLPPEHQMSALFPVDTRKMSTRGNDLRYLVKVQPSVAIEELEQSVDWLRKRRTQQLLRLRKERPSGDDPASMIAFGHDEWSRSWLHMIVDEAHDDFRYFQNDANAQRGSVRTALRVAIGLIHRMPMPPVERMKLLDLLYTLSTWLRAVDSGVRVRQFEKRRPKPGRPRDAQYKKSFQSKCVDMCAELVASGWEIEDAAKEVYKRQGKTAAARDITGKGGFTATRVEGWYARAVTARNKAARSDRVRESDLVLALTALWGGRADAELAKHLQPPPPYGTTGRGAATKRSAQKV